MAKTPAMTTAAMRARDRVNVRPIVSSKPACVPAAALSFIGLSS